MKSMSEMNFGDYSGLREYRRSPGYFMESFIDPESFSLNSLRNNENFIIIGRKGTGKSSCCLALADRKSKDGFKTSFFSFSDDLSKSDLRAAVQTQSIDLRTAELSKLHDSIVEFYDFRDIWIRKVIYSIAEKLASSGVKSNFVSFATSIQLAESSISDGVGRGLLVSWDSVKKYLPPQLNVEQQRKQFTLKEFNAACLSLLLELHKDEKHYFFFDELNLSHSKSDSSEYSTLIALVRDVVRASAFLNDEFSEKGIDINVICSLRPEIRDQVILRDSEMSKIIDSNSVNLSWPIFAKTSNPLLRLMRSKLMNNGLTEAEVDQVIPKSVLTLEGESVPFEKYFLNITWYRPRDVVRVLKSFQKTNGKSTVLLSGYWDQISFLKEYSRVSAQECLAELEVKYSKQVIDQAVSRFKKALYADVQELSDFLLPLENRVNLDEFIKDLFDAGIIFNHDRSSGELSLYASYLNDAMLDTNLRILIHRGLQPYFHLSKNGGK